MIPADGSGDWDAVDAGALRYVETLLATDLESGSAGIYAGGPYRESFSAFQNLSAVKREGWKREIDRLRELYVSGAAELDARAGGSFATLPAELQDAILTTLDLENSDFFRAFYNHTMEAVYGHPAYGGNTGFVAWNDLCYEGDVHGVRFPNVGDPQAAWNLYGGYAPDEMDKPGSC